MIGRLVLVAVFVLVMAAYAYAAAVEATVNSIDTNGVGAAIGTVTFKDTKSGLLITPDLHGLPAGVHGFHVHAKADCAPAEQNGKKVAGLAAGGHHDPRHTGKHLGPYETKGHRGDLPVLVVGEDGKATLPVLAPHLTVKDLRGHAIIVHAGADNYSDQPAPLGGGGARIACGVIK